MKELLVMILTGILMIQFKAMRLLNGKQLNIIELPMPEKLIYDDQRLPCSYANFYPENNPE